MKAKQAKKVTAILNCEEFAKLQGNKDFILGMQVADIQKNVPLETNMTINAINYAKLIGRYMLKGAEYLKSKEGKNELEKVNLSFNYVDFYMKELNKKKSAIYEYMDLGKLTDEQIKEQTDKGVIAKRDIINNCKGKNEGENVGEGEGEGEGEVKVKPKTFSCTINKDDKLTLKNEDTLTLQKIALIKQELQRIEDSIKKEIEEKLQKSAKAKAKREAKAKKTPTKVVQVVGGFDVVGA